MGKIIGYLRRAVLIALGTAAAWALASALGPWAGLGAWAVLTAGACVLSAELLKGSGVGRVTWRNYLAGYVLPWGFRIGRGRLGAITVAAWAVWVLIGMAAILLMGHLRWSGSASATDTPAAPAPDGPHPVLAVLLFTTWVVYGVCLLHLVGLLLNQFRASPGPRGTVLKAAASLVALLAGSAALWFTGHPGWPSSSPAVPSRWSAGAFCCSSGSCSP